MEAINAHFSIHIYTIKLLAAGFDHFLDRSPQRSGDFFF